MPASRDSFSRLRASAETRVKQALAQTRGAAIGNDDIFARARLASADITERYWVEQVLSVSPSERMDAEPTGKIELAIPYDGYDFFTRQARKDVIVRCAGKDQRGATASVGHLLLHGYSKSSLGAQLSLSDSHGAVPIKVQVGDTDNPDWLTADRQTCVNTCEFTVDQPGIVPTQLDVGLYDPDSLDALRLELDQLELSQLEHPGPETYQLVNSIISKMKQQVSFRNDLLLSIQVILTLPIGAEAPIPRARVARVAIGWPTITSLRTLSLHTLTHDGDGVITETEVPIRYNPEKTALEWEDIQFLAPVRNRSEDLVRYLSPPMLLSIRHPGELYQEKELKIHGEVEVSGYLLSGLQAELYQANGRRSDDDRQPELTTRIDVDTRLMLYDAFAKRDFTPSQQLFFDEVIPDETRITDIRNSLEERGFKVSPSNGMPVPGGSGEVVRWFLVAQRQEGPYTMELWVVVEGRHFVTVEETTRGAGQTHTTERQTGDLQVFIRGMLARDSKELTHEMNALQRTLRDRYSRVRQRR